MTSILSAQYHKIKESREVLLNYCAGISHNKLQEQLPAFGDRSIIFLLNHVANVYEFWIGIFPSVTKRPLTQFRFDVTIEDIRRQYNDVDVLMKEFLQMFPGAESEEITNYIPDNKQPITVTPLALFTHVITHEFHHKGQILSMSRMLGYTPIDTDIIRL